MANARPIPIVAPSALARLALYIALCGCGASATPLAIGLATANVRIAASDGALHACRGAEDAAFRAATSTVRDVAAALDTRSDAFHRLAFVELIRRGDLETASIVTWFWAPTALDPDAFELYLAVLDQTGRFEQAQELAWAAARERPDDRARWIRAWYEALAADPERFPGPLDDLRPGPLVDEFDAFTGQSSIILKMEHQERTVGVFKPHQRLRHQYFRGEVAAYRLCHLIRCTFTIPTSREAWVEESQFRAMAEVESDDDLSFGTRRELIFFRDADGRRRLYGVAKAWVADFTRFPVEYTDVWRPLVATGHTPDSLRSRNIASALSELDGRPRGFYRGIVDRSGAMSAFDLSRQLSEIHVFDLLINNFDRYQPEWVGMNAHWDSGGFVSIDNGASFSLPEEFGWGATRRRVEQIEVFPRSMIDAIRWMDADAAYALLFPPNPWFTDEPERFEQFMVRREWLLDYVDELVERYGEDAVYIFP